MDDRLRQSQLLVLDDDPDNVHLMQLLFETSGFTRVHACSDPRDIEGLLGQLEPDVVLLDLHMPGLGGIEVMRRIQETVPDRRIPVIVVSGDVSPENQRVAEAAGAIGFVAKPFDTGSLVATVEKALNDSKDAAG